MYRRILVPLENSRTDVAILEHVTALAKHCHASVVLIHVADGFVARNYKSLDLRESEEMHADREYLERCCEALEAAGIESESLLAGGDPAGEIIRAADAEHCDLIAMSTHGHGMVKDLLFGSVANEVRHRTHIPVLCVRGGVAPTPGGVPAVAQRPAAQ